MAESSEEVLRLVHIASWKSRHKIEREGTASCFHCKKKMKVEEVVDWLDDELTGMCPHCGIDSLLPGEVSDELLSAMKKKWFF